MLEFDRFVIKISRNDTVDLKKKNILIAPEKWNALKIYKSTLWYAQKKIKESNIIKVDERQR